MSGLPLASAEDARKGGAHGAAIVPGKPDESLVLRAIVFWTTEFRCMPCSQGAKGRDRVSYRVRDEWSHKVTRPSWACSASIAA